MGLCGNESVIRARKLLLCIALGLAACGGRTQQQVPGGESEGAAGHFPGEDTGGNPGHSGTGGADGGNSDPSGTGGADGGSSGLAGIGGTDGGSSGFSATGGTDGGSSGFSATGGASGGSSPRTGPCGEEPVDAEPEGELSPEIVWKRIARFLADRDDVPMTHGTPDTPEAAGDAALSLLDQLDAELHASPGLTRFLEHWMPGLELIDLWGAVLSSERTTLEAILTLRRSGPPVPAFGITTDTGVLRKPGIDARGAYLFSTLLCVSIPGSHGSLPAPSRAAHDESIAAATCSGCHRGFDPLGYSLEIFDTQGNYRKAFEDGTPVDSSGTFVTPSGETFAFTSIYDLAPQLATSCDVAACLSRRLLEYALDSAGLDSSTIDDTDVQRITARFARSNFEIRALIRHVVESPAFLR